MNSPGYVPNPRDATTPEEWERMGRLFEEAWALHRAGISRFARELLIWSPVEAERYYASQGIRNYDTITLNPETVRRFGSEVEIKGYSDDGTPNGNPVAMWIERYHAPISVYKCRCRRDHQTKASRDSCWSSCPKNDSKAIPTLQAIISKVRGYAQETRHGPNHVRRWNQVLTALGVDGQGERAMTLDEAERNYRRYSKRRWAPVVQAIKSSQGGN